MPVDESDFRETAFVVVLLLRGEVCQSHALACGIGGGDGGQVGRMVESVGKRMSDEFLRGQHVRRIGL